MITRALTSAAFAFGMCGPAAGAAVITLPPIVDPPKPQLFAAAMTAGVEPDTQMARIEGLVARLPIDGRPVSERTAVYLGYDGQKLYAVFMCYDTDATRIRSEFAPRDRFPEDNDSVALHIATYPDGIHMNGFQANAAGARIDGIFTEGEGWDLSFDPEWHVDTVITPAGYVVAIAVPFTSLRFPPTDIQRWGFFLYRGIPRRNEEAFYPEFSTRIAGRVGQAGTMEGIHLQTPDRRWEFTPYVTARKDRLGTTSVRSEFEAGLDTKFIWKDQLVFDMTLNPDFSQVESDEPQVMANQRFEVFFPEKRPFFIENAGYFSTPINLLFTRRIVDPSAGIRMTGRVNEWSVGALVIDDSHGENALLAAANIRRHSSADSYLGVFTLHSSIPSTDTGMLSAYGRLALTPGWSATWQAAGSRTATTAGSLHGGATYASLSGTGERWAYAASAQIIDETFDAPVGFIPRSGIREVTQAAGYRFHHPIPWLLSYGPELETRSVWRRDGGVLDEDIALRWRVELTGQTVATIERRYRTERLAYDGGTSRLPQSLTGMAVSSAWFTRVTFAAALFVGDGVNFNPLPATAPAVHDSRTSEFSVTVRATQNLAIDVARLDSALDQVFTASMVRLRARYQFNRAWSARLIIDSLKTEPHANATTIMRERGVTGDALIQWQPSSASRLFAGMLRQHDRLNDAGNGRSFFLKYSRRFVH